MTQSRYRGLRAAKLKAFVPGVECHVAGCQSGPRAPGHRRLSTQWEGIVLNVLQLSSVGYEKRQGWFHSAGSDHRPDSALSAL